METVAVWLIQINAGPFGPAQDAIRNRDSVALPHAATQQKSARENTP